MGLAGAVEIGAEARPFHFLGFHINADVGQVGESGFGHGDHFRHAGELGDNQFEGVALVSRFLDQSAGAVGVKAVLVVKFPAPAVIPARQAGVKAPDGMGGAVVAEQSFVDFLAVNGPVDGLADADVQVGVGGVVIGAEGRKDAAHNESDLDGRQFAFYDRHAAGEGFRVQVAIHFSDLHLAGE